MKFQVEVLNVKWARSQIYCFMFLRKFVHMFSNNMNFISISMHKAKVYKKFLFLDCPMEDPEISIIVPFTSLPAPILSAFQGISQRSELFYSNDQVEGERLLLLELSGLSFSSPYSFFLQTCISGGGGEKPRMKTLVS